MMDAVLAAVDKLAREEYDRASKEHGMTHASPHEAYAVIREELEEATDDNFNVCKKLEEIVWEYIKADDIDGYADQLPDMYRETIHGAAEMIQAAAMILKAGISVDRTF